MTALERGGVLLSEARGCAHCQRFANRFLAAAVQFAAYSYP